MKKERDKKKKCQVRSWFKIIKQIKKEEQEKFRKDGKK